MEAKVEGNKVVLPHTFLKKPRKGLFLRIDININVQNKDTHLIWETYNNTYNYGALPDRVKELVNAHFPYYERFNTLNPYEIVAKISVPRVPDAIEKSLAQQRDEAARTGTFGGRFSGESGVMEVEVWEEVPDSYHPGSGQSKRRRVKKVVDCDNLPPELRGNNIPQACVVRRLVGSNARSDKIMRGKAKEAGAAKIRAVGRSVGAAIGIIVDDLTSGWRNTAHDHPDDLLLKNKDPLLGELIKFNATRDHEQTQEAYIARLEPHLEKEYEKIKDNLDDEIRPLTYDVITGADKGYRYSLVPGHDDNVGPADAVYHRYYLGK